MARQANEQALVNAILDAEIGMDEIADRATAVGDTLAERLTIISRNLVKLSVAKQITKERAAYFFKQAYIVLTLIGFTHVAQDVKDHGDDTVSKITTLAKAYFKDNPNASSLAIIEKVEKEQRKKERSDGGQA